MPSIRYLRTEGSWKISRGIIGRQMLVLVAGGPVCVFVDEISGCSEFRVIHRFVQSYPQACGVKYVLESVLSKKMVCNSLILLAIFGHCVCESTKVV